MTETLITPLHNLLPTRAKFPGSHSSNPRLKSSKTLGETFPGVGWVVGGRDRVFRLSWTPTPMSLSPASGEEKWELRSNPFEQQPRRRSCCSRWRRLKASPPASGREPSPDGQGEGGSAFPVGGVSSGEGLLRGQVEAGVQEDGEGADGGEDDESPEEETVNHEGHVFPVFLQLERLGERGERSMDRSGVGWVAWKGPLRHLCDPEGGRRLGAPPIALSNLGSFQLGGSTDFQTPSGDKVLTSHRLMVWRG